PVVTRSDPETATSHGGRLVRRAGHSDKDARSSVKDAPSSAMSLSRNCPSKVEIIGKPVNGLFAIKGAMASAAYGVNFCIPNQIKMATIAHRKNARCQ